MLGWGFILCQKYLFLRNSHTHSRFVIISSNIHILEKLYEGNTIDTELKGLVKISTVYYCEEIHGIPVSSWVFKYFLSYHHRWANMIKTVGSCCLNISVDKYLYSEIYVVMDLGTKHASNDWQLQIFNVVKFFLLSMTIIQVNQIHFLIQEQDKR